MYSRKLSLAITSLVSNVMDNYKDLVLIFAISLQIGVVYWLHYNASIHLLNNISNVLGVC